MRFNLEGVQRIVSNASDTAAVPVLNVSATQTSLSLAEGFVSIARSAVSSAETTFNATQLESSPTEVRSNYSQVTSASSMTSYTVTNNVRVISQLNEKSGSNLLNQARSTLDTATHNYISSARTKELGEALVNAAEASKTECQCCIHSRSNSNNNINASQTLLQSLWH
jgi:hypothetical protein